jgi:hypothetical protein
VLPEVKYSSVFPLFEVLFMRHDLIEEFLVQSQVCDGGEQPAVAKLTLLHVEARGAVRDELGIGDNL